MLGPVADSITNLGRLLFSLPLCFFGLGIGGNTHAADELHTVERMRDNIEYHVTLLSEYTKM